MSRKAFLAVIAVLTAINIGTLALNTSNTVRAEVDGMDFRDLRRDRDFKKAVWWVVDGNCTADSDGAISC